MSVADRCRVLSWEPGGKQSDIHSSEEVVWWQKVGRLTWVCGSIFEEFISFPTHCPGGDGLSGQAYCLEGTVFLFLF